MPDISFFSGKKNTSKNGSNGVCQIFNSFLETDTSKKGITVQCARSLILFWKLILPKGITVECAIFNSFLVIKTSKRDSNAVCQIFNSFLVINTSKRDNSAVCQIFISLLEGKTSKRDNSARSLILFWKLTLPKGIAVECA